MHLQAFERRLSPLIFQILHEKLSGELLSPYSLAFIASKRQPTHEHETAVEEQSSATASPPPPSMLKSLGKSASVRLSRAGSLRGLGTSRSEVGTHGTFAEFLAHVRFEFAQFEFSAVNDSRTSVMLALLSALAQHSLRASVMRREEVKMMKMMMMQMVTTLLSFQTL